MNIEKTPYSKIFKKFTRKITDFGLFLQCEEMTNIELIGLLESACDEYFLCKKDLEDRDDDLMAFNFKLTSREQSILAKYMILEWVRPNILSVLDLKPILGDKDFQVFSQANFLKQKQELLDSIKSEGIFHQVNEDYAPSRIREFLK